LNAWAILKITFSTTTNISSTFSSITWNLCKIWTLYTFSIFQYLFSATTCISTFPSLLIGVFWTILASSIFYQFLSFITIIFLTLFSVLWNMSIRLAFLTITFFE
jgi:hypothetical protein